MTRPHPATVRWLMLAVVLVLWEAVPRAGLIPELLLPPLSKTLAALIKDWDGYGAALLVTWYEGALAMLIECGAGILGGARFGVMGRRPVLFLPVCSRVSRR